jgi:hypothetical protein
MGENTPQLSFEAEDQLYNHLLNTLHDACGRHDIPTAEQALWALERRFPEEAVTARLVFVAVFAPPDQ